MVTTKSRLAAFPGGKYGRDWAGRDSVIVRTAQVRKMPSFGFGRGAYGFNAKKVTDAGMFIYSWMSGRVSGNKEHKMTDYRFITRGRKIISTHSPRLPLPNYAVIPFANMMSRSSALLFRSGRVTKTTSSMHLTASKRRLSGKWEAIVADDTNSDKLLSILDRTYPYTRYIKNTRGKGAGGARNSGADIARGRFIVFLDADDWLHPEALDRMFSAWEKNLAIIYTDILEKRS